MHDDSPHTMLISTDALMSENADPLQRALASLMLSIKANQPMQVVRLEHSSLHKHPDHHRAAYVAIKWTDPNQQPRAVVYVDSASRYWAEHPPTEHPGINDTYSVFDKLIDAVNYHYDIQTFVDDDGNAVLTWDRASHGNCPAIILTPDNEVLTYYDAPQQTKERLDRTVKERYAATSIP